MSGFQLAQEDFYKSQFAVTFRRFESQPLQCRQTRMISSMFGFRVVVVISVHSLPIFCKKSDLYGVETRYGADMKSDGMSDHVSVRSEQYE